MKLYFVSLGCDKNLVDTEVMLGLLAKEGYEFTDDENEADVAVVNTCCFIGDAKEESINTIIELGQLKSFGNLKGIIISGCLAQRYYDEIHDELPEVDVVLSANSIDSIVDAVRGIENGLPKDYRTPVDRKPLGNMDRVITTGGHYDYLKIAEGCSRCCTYCIIPKVKGPYRSIPMEELISEASKLAEKGVKELILVAQETTIYGVDIYGRKALPELLRKLCAVDGLEWIRLLYCYPEEITDELIATIKSEPKIVHYLDMPIQSGSDRILKLMGRRTSHGEILSLISRIRTEIPDMALRTTLITGFPSESNEDHELSMKLVREGSFDRLGVFKYSPEEDTPAAEFDDQIDDDIKEKRWNEIMALQQEIAFSKAEAVIGRTVRCFVVGYLPEDNVYVCRTYMDAPDVDGYLFATSDTELMSGNLVDVLVTDSNEYDLIGEINELTE